MSWINKSYTILKDFCTLSHNDFLSIKAYLAKLVKAPNFGLGDVGVRAL